LKILVLGLGNDLIADDAIGVLAARRLAPLLADRADVVDSPQTGVALLELFLGYQRAIVIDAILTGGLPPGTILELAPSDLRAVRAPSPHYTGLPEMLAMARELRLVFPTEILILAVEVVDLTTIGGPLSGAVEAALPTIIDRVVQVVDRWEHPQEGPPRRIPGDRRTGAEGEAGTPGQ
jgi:hydrogenase maturation protease